jgi:hypothetical protein
MTQPSSSHFIPFLVALCACVLVGTDRAE